MESVGRRYGVDSISVRSEGEYREVSSICLPDGIVLSIEASTNFVRVGVLLKYKFILHNPYGPAMMRVSDAARLREVCSWLERWIRAEETGYPVHVSWAETYLFNCFLGVSRPFDYVKGPADTKRLLMENFDRLKRWSGDWGELVECARAMIPLSEKEIMVLEAGFELAK